MSVLAAALAVATGPLLPLWAAACTAHPRLRGDLRGRFALEIPPVAPGAVWIHAASVGEVAAAEALAASLGGSVLITADTDTGAARARQIDLPGTVGGIRPVDHPWLIAPLWAEARPRVLIFVEGTWWPQLAQMARHAGVPVVRVSAKSGRRTRRMAGSLYRRWVAATDLVLARDEAEAAWFRGAQNAPVEVGGDLKASGALGVNPLRWRRPFAVGASTRPGDEVALLDAVGDLGLLLAPRHPERFDTVAGILDDRGLSWERRSSTTGEVRADVVLLDTLGELQHCLIGAQVAFVGGTFDPTIGGHGPQEAARAGVPVVSGPHNHANRAAFEACGATTVQDPGQLARALREARAIPIPTDAAKRTAARIRELAGPAAPEAAPRPWARRLSSAWTVGAAARNALYDRGVLGSTRVAVPVISVGSANSRGSGKTSTVRWLAAILRELGYRPGIALRGYGRTGGRGVELGGDVAKLGDEGALLAADDLLVAAGPDRIAGARALVDAGADVILLDDGLQHRRLFRDLDIVVVDARFPTGRSSLPAGEGREQGIPARADLVVVHHVSELFPAPETDVPQLVLRRIPGPWNREGLRGPVAVFAGIGRPADFLEDLDLEVARFRALADHQPVADELARELVAWADGLPLVCTAKDAVRLPESLKNRVWWRDIALEGESPVALLASAGISRR